MRSRRTRQEAGGDRRADVVQERTRRTRRSTSTRTSTTSTSAKRDSRKRRRRNSRPTARRSTRFAGGFGGGFGGGGKGGGGDGARRRRPIARRGRTSPGRRDSKAFYVTRTDTRGVKDLFLVDSLADAAADARKVQVPDAGRGSRPQERAATTAMPRRRRSRKSRRSGRTSAIQRHPLGQEPGRTALHPPRPAAAATSKSARSTSTRGECKCLFAEAFEAAYPRHADSRATSMNRTR